MSIFFFVYKIRGQEVRTGSAWGLGTSVQEERGGERVWEGEYGANTVYTCM
jgi:hypothetical protein